jgi:hypothetical protein
MQFEPLDQGVGFAVLPGTHVTLGRLPQFKLTHARISRHHAELAVQQQQQKGDSVPLVVTCLAHKRVEVKRGADVHTVQPGQQFQVGLEKKFIKLQPDIWPAMLVTCPFPHRI